jgi:hypothetical protein
MSFSIFFRELSWAVTAVVMSSLDRVNSRESIIQSKGGALLVTDCNDCQATAVKGVFSVWSWRINWLMREVFPMPGNPIIEIAMISVLISLAFKISISFVRSTQFLTWGKLSGRGKFLSFSESWGRSAIAAAKSNSVCFISLRSIISSQLLIPTALQISINVSRRIDLRAQNRFKVACEVRAARHQVTSVLFHLRLRLIILIIVSPSSDALSKPAITQPLTHSILCWNFTSHPLTE